MSDTLMPDSLESEGPGRKRRVDDPDNLSDGAFEIDTEIPSEASLSRMHEPSGESDEDALTLDLGDLGDLGGLGSGAWQDVDSLELKKIPPEILESGLRDAPGAPPFVPSEDVEIGVTDSIFAESRDGLIAVAEETGVAEVQAAPDQDASAAAVEAPGLASDAAMDDEVPASQGPEQLFDQNSVNAPDAVAQESALDEAPVDAPIAAEQEAVSEGTGQTDADTAALKESDSGDEPQLDEPIDSRIVAFLQDRGKLGNTDFARARRLAEESGDEILRMLVRLGLVSERDMAQAFSDVMEIPLAGPADYPDAPVAPDIFSLRFLKDARVLPLREDEAELAVAVADPAEPFILRAVAMAAGKAITPAVGLPSEIELALERLYEKEEEVEGDDFAALGDVSEDDIEHLKDLASEAPVIRLVNQIIQRAVESRASDIHIEPFEDELKVRYRVDGILKEVESPPPRSTAAVISRIKIMSKLNIAERRLPQDGRIPLRVQGKELDLRVSTVPTMFGESVVMRLLDKESVRFDFDALGFDGSPRDRVGSILEMPYGIFLVTGPTGSGKSTTLYTAMSRLNTQERKIITVEDPVEYQLPGINQIQVKPQIGMTFAGALRSIVRQDPDIIMVGEMRDLETARIAVQSALTGHVVLSTLHTNDAASGITRLLDMGVEEYLLTSTINGILAQRLVRRLCPLCRERYEPMPELALKFVRIHDPDDEDIRLYRPVGCDQCNETGYLGRMVITEVLLMSDGIRQAVLTHATAGEIQRQAIAEGMRTMYDDGLRKALDGRTTIEEVMRVAEES